MRKQRSSASRYTELSDSGNLKPATAAGRGLPEDAEWLPETLPWPMAKGQSASAIGR